MTTLALPTHILPESQEWGIKSNTRVTQSIFTRITQTQEVPGALWACRYNYPLLSDPQMKIFKGWLLQLRGQANRFYGRDLGFVGQSLSLTATATLGATTATLSGAATVSIGDYVKVGNELKMIVADSTGTTITIEPPFREAHTTDTTNFLDPDCIMILDRDSIKWNSASPLLHSLEFSATEALI